MAGKKGKLINTQSHFLTGNIGKKRRDEGMSKNLPGM
jgi:hypothetical protein